MVKTESDDNPNGDEIKRVELDPSVERVYLRADMDFKQKTDKAGFFYSLDGKEWSQIGDTLQMAYTLILCRWHIRFRISWDIALDYLIMRL